MTGVVVDRRLTGSFARWPDRWWVPALGGLVLALAFVGALLVRAGGDPSLLVHAGPPWTDATGARGSLTVQEPDQAFDGQFFYRLGISPWSTDATVEGVTFDLPALRNARWGYGALAFAASGGDPDMVPWALIGLNVLAAAAVGGIGGGLARSAGRHAAWGLLFVLWPGFAYSLSLDTSELVASAFLLGGILSLRFRRWGPAAALLAAAVLTRDTTTAVVFGLGVGALWWWLAPPGRLRDRTTAWAGPAFPAPAGEAAPTPSSEHRSGGLTGLGPDGPVGSAAAVGTVSEAGTAAVCGWGTGGALLPDGEPTEPVGPEAARPVVAVAAAALAAFGAWQLIQRSRFGELPLTSSGDNNLAAPLAGLFDQLGTLLPPSGAEEWFRLVCMVALVGLLTTAAWAWNRSATPWPELVAFVPAVAVVVMLNAYLWSGATAFARAATEAGLMAVIVLLGAPGRRTLPLLGLGLGGVWLLTAIAQLSKLG